MPPNLLERGLDQRLDVGAARDVGADRQAARFPSRALRGLVIQVRDHDMRAFVGEAAHDAFAEAGRAAGHDRDFVLQAA